MYPTPLPLAAYRAAVSLDEPFGPHVGHNPDARSAELVREALALLADDSAAAKAGLHPDSADGIDDDAARRLLRSVLTVREPGPLSTEAAQVLDALLADQHRARDTSLVRVNPTHPETPDDLADRTLSVPAGADHLLDALTVPHPAPDPAVAP
ncbi:hypothetical protein [Streptomyces canus]|uniref:hypothetical protein n=1 Tax=Streptomyces canus TaxID=58343 RepID=UPI0033BE30D9